MRLVLASSKICYDESIWAHKKFPSANLPVERTLLYLAERETTPPPSRSRFCGERIRISAYYTKRFLYRCQGIIQNHPKLVVFQSKLYQDSMLCISVFIVLLTLLRSEVSLPCPFVVLLTIKFNNKITGIPQNITLYSRSSTAFCDNLLGNITKLCIKQRSSSRFINLYLLFSSSIFIFRNYRMRSINKHYRICSFVCAPPLIYDTSYFYYTSNITHLQS